MKEEGGRRKNSQTHIHIQNPAALFPGVLKEWLIQRYSRGGHTRRCDQFSCGWQHFRDVAKRKLREDTRSQSSGLLELAESEGVDIEEMVFEQTLDRGLCKSHLGRDDSHIGNAVVRVQEIY
jgi:hypothetical protein